MPRTKRDYSPKLLMAKPIQHQKRTYQLQVAFNGLELEYLHKKAETAHMALATYVRMACMNYKRKWKEA